MAFTSPAEQRNILALSFEPADNGYVYYHNRWSGGIPVTEEERAEYLEIPVFGSRRAWRKSIAGRASLPRRAYNPVARSLLIAAPIRVGVLGLLFGATGIMSGLKQPTAVLTAVYLVAGCTMIVFGGSIIAARFMRSSG